jgi:hypothetical protein
MKNVAKSADFDLPQPALKNRGRIAKIDEYAATVRSYSLDVAHPHARPICPHGERTSHAHQRLAVTCGYGADT